MTKSKKQFSEQQTPGMSDEFVRTVELAFGDHPWPASRDELLEHADRQGTFARSDLARLKRIPHREYHSMADLMEAARKADATMAQSPGPVTTAEHNRRAMGDTPVKVKAKAKPKADLASASQAREPQFREPTH